VTTQLQLINIIIIIIIINYYYISEPVFWGNKTADL